MTERQPGRIIRFPGGGTNALQLRVDWLLAGAPAWRRILLSDRATFWDLHVAIQDAFGWSDGPFLLFTLDDPESGSARRLGAPGTVAAPPGGEVEPVWSVALAGLLRIEAEDLLYVCGRSGERTLGVALEDAEVTAQASSLPRCLAGAGPEGAFDPEGVVFTNPQQCWSRVFDHE